MSIFLAVKGGKINLEPNPDWAWQGFDGEIPLDATQSLLSVKGKPVVINTDFPQNQNVGKNYTTPIHSQPGTVQSVQLFVDSSTLSTHIFSEEAGVTEKTRGQFQATVSQPALTAKGEPDLILVKTGQWSVAECGQEIMVVEATAPQSLFKKIKRVPTSKNKPGEELAKNSKPSSSEPKISYGKNAKKEFVSEHTEKVLRDALKKSGNDEATISSTARNPYNQARVMYNNLERKGVFYQKKLYGKYGDQVIEVYEKSKKAGKNREQIIKDMESKIKEIGPSNVSKHAADPNLLQVIDVVPNSIISSQPS